MKPDGRSTRTAKTRTARNGSGFSSDKINHFVSTLSSALPGAAHCSETFLELVDASLRIHKLVLAGKEGMRVGSDAAGDHVVLHAVNGLGLRGLSRGVGDETATCGYIHKYNRMIVGV